MRTILSLARHYRMHAYYLGLVAVGAFAIILGGGVSSWPYSAGTILLGASLLWARCWRRPAAEAILIRGVAVVTALQALSVWHEVGPPAPLPEPSELAVTIPAAIRLAIAPLMMWDWAAYRRDSAQISELRRSVQRCGQC